MLCLCNFYRINTKFVLSNICFGQFYMETMRKSVYPVHKLETTINDDMGSIDDDRY